MKPNYERRARMAELMEQGYTRSTADHIYNKERSDPNYVHRSVTTRPSLTKQELIDNGITVEVDVTQPSGFLVKRYGSPLTPRKVVTGLNRTVGRWQLQITINRKIRNVALTSIVWLLLYDGEDIPGGYCIDHIDFNPENNSKDNMQLVTIGENIKRNRYAPRVLFPRNQYTKDMTPEEYTAFKLAREQEETRRKEIMKSAYHFLSLRNFYREQANLCKAAGDMPGWHLHIKKCNDLSAILRELRKNRQKNV